MPRPFASISPLVPTQPKARQVFTQPVGIVAASLPCFERLTDKYPQLLKTNNYQHLGTLGTGNHVIEVCLDETQQVWVTRKGAVSAQQGQMGIIPGSEGATRIDIELGGKLGVVLKCSS